MARKEFIGFLLRAALGLNLGLMAEEKEWGLFDRLIVTQKFLDAVYPNLKTSEGLITLRSQAFHADGGAMDEIDVIPCDPGSGIAGGYRPGEPPHLLHCTGLYPSRPSDFLSVEVRFFTEFPIHYFSARGSFLGSKGKPARQEIIDHPEWNEEQRIETLRRSGPTFGPEHKQEFLRIVPVDAIRRFTGCNLQPETDVLIASRAEAPPDPPVAGFGWRISGRYDRRAFNASQDKVWRVWNDADSIKHWWGPKGYTAPFIRNDLRVGETYLWAMKSPKGEMFWNTAVYKEVVSNRRIVSTISFPDETGKAVPGSKAPVPGRWPNAVTVIVEFSESSGKTKVTVTEVGLPMIVEILSRVAWDQQFDKIEGLL
jgi:uncharacterized protein YndB with AHSA1/START domain